MRTDIKSRVLDEAIYMINTGDTIRTIAKVFKVSKSTVHKDLHDRLKYIDEKLFEKVSDILRHHLEIRHIRGGQSTRNKYLNLRK